MSKKVIALLGFCFCHFSVIRISSFQPSVFVKMMIENGEIPAVQQKKFVTMTRQTLRHGDRSPESSAFLRRTGGHFLFLWRTDAQFLQERLDRLLAAEKLL